MPTVTPPDFHANASLLFLSFLTLLFWVPAWRLYNRVMDRWDESLGVDLVFTIIGATLLLFLSSYA